MSSKAEKYSKRGVRTSYVSTVIGISLVLFVITIVLGGSLALEMIQTQARESLQGDVFFKPEYSEADIKQIEQELRSWPYFSQVTFVDAEHAINAITDLEQNPEEILSALDGISPIPTTISYNPKSEYADLAGMNEIKAALLKAYPEEIEEVFYDESSIDEVNLGFMRIVYLIAVVALLLIVVAVAMINNTIRLALYSQRFTIKTMQLVGATARYIRRPFLMKSVLQGVVSSILGLALFMAMLYIVNNLLNVFQISIPLMSLLILFGAVMLLGILISYISTWFALNKYLRMKVDDLY